jgi:hypothetical protein
MRYMRQYLVQLCSRPFISSHTSYSSNNMMYYNHLLISFNILFSLICSTRSYNSYLSGNAVPTSFHNTLGTLPPIVMRKRGETFHLDLNQPPPEEESPQEVADSSAMVSIWRAKNIDSSHLPHIHHPTGPTLAYEENKDTLNSNRPDLSVSMIIPFSI